MDRTSEFESERPRLVRIAARVLGDPAEAEDVVQQAWLRLARADPEHYLVLDAHGAVEEIAAAVHARLAPLLEAVRT